MQLCMTKCSVTSRFVRTEGLTNAASVLSTDIPGLRLGTEAPISDA